MKIRAFCSKINLSLISNIINRVAGVHLKKRYENLLHTSENYLYSQDKLFKKIKKSLKNTVISKDLGLNKISCYRDYVKNIPVHEYDFFKPYIERVANGEKNVMFKDPLLSFFTTSGTSLRSKKIPCNQALKSSFLNLQINVAAISYMTGPKIQPLADRFIYGCKTKLEAFGLFSQNFLTGFLSSQTPRIMRGHIFPSSAALAIDDWDEKVQAIASEIEHIDIKAIGALPSYLLILAQDLTTYFKVKTLHEIWPNMQLHVYSGTEIENYLKPLNAIIGSPIYYLGLFVATESPLGMQLECSKIPGEYSLNVGDVLYSFNDLEDPSGTPFSIDELEVGKKYLVNIGTCNGMLQYSMQDCILIKSIKPHLKFDIVGRLNIGMNVASERVSENDLIRAVELAKQKFDIKIEAHFFIYPSLTKNQRPYYEWVFGVEKPSHHSIEKLQKIIDESLISVAKIYGEYRKGIIAAPQVELVPSHFMRQYFTRHQTQGQFKMKRVFKNKEEFKRFAKEEFFNWNGESYNK